MRLLNQLTSGPLTIKLNKELLQGGGLGARRANLVLEVSTPDSASVYPLVEAEQEAIDRIEAAYMEASVVILRNYYRGRETGYHELLAELESLFPWLKGYQALASSDSTSQPDPAESNEPTGL